MSEPEIGGGLRVLAKSFEDGATKSFLLQAADEFDRLNEHRPEILDLLTADLQRIAHDLGIPARPYSGHEAMERDILPAIWRLRQIEAAFDVITTKKIPRELGYPGNPTSAISEKEREWRGG